jgi:hypothetical protein
VNDITKVKCEKAAVACLKSITPNSSSTPQNHLREVRSSSGQDISVSFKDVDRDAQLVRLVV